MSRCFPTANENKEYKNSGQIFQLYGSLNVSAKNPIFFTVNNCYDKETKSPPAYSYEM